MKRLIIVLCMVLLAAGVQGAVVLTNHPSPFNAQSLSNFATGNAPLGGTGLMDRFSLDAGDVTWQTFTLTSGIYVDSLYIGYNDYRWSGVITLAIDVGNDGIDDYTYTGIILSGLTAEGNNDGPVHYLQFDLSSEKIRLAAGMHKYTITCTSEDTGSPTFLIAPLRNRSDTYAGGDCNFQYLGALNDSIFAVTAITGRTASDPNPANGQTMAGTVNNSTGKVDVNLSWTAGTDTNITGHYVYMSNGTADPNLFILNGGNVVTSPALSVTGLAFNTTYRWRVDEQINHKPASDPNNITGFDWTFTTIPQAPVITAQPANQSVFPGENAVFTVSATNPIGGSMTYKWYKSADGVIDGADTLLSSGSDLNSLTVAVSSDTATAVANNQAYYYCVIDNGIQQATNVVFLLVKRNIAHYAFDGNANDSSVQANNGTWANPALAAYDTTNPVIGSGVVVFAGTDPNSYINIGTNAAPNYQAGIGGGSEGSASYWFKATSTAFMAVCGTFNTGLTSAFQLNLNETVQGRLTAYIRGQDGTVTSMTVDKAVADLLNGQWHHVAFTWSASANEGAVYVDGEKAATSTVGSPILAAWEYPMVIGARNIRGTMDAYFVGELDELKIFNYPLTQRDVSIQYVAGPADWVCETYPELDWNRNCVVDLADFAVFAAQWLECGRYPHEQCQ